MGCPAAPHGECSCAISDDLRFARRPTQGAAKPCGAQALTWAPRPLGEAAGGVTGTARGAVRQDLAQPGPPSG